MLDKPLKELTFTVVDTETTGMSPKFAQLLEIAAVRIRPNLTIDLSDTFSELINPTCSISYSAFRVHGISHEMVADKPDISAVMPRFTSFVQDTVIVAHNARFDMGFIDCAITDNSLFSTHLAVIDTIKLAKKAFPGYKSYSLDSMIAMLGLDINIDSSYRHRALYDAVHTAALLVKCIDALDSKGIRYIHDLYPCKKATK